VADTRIASNDRIRIAYEVLGSMGPWLLLVQGLGYGRWGWEPIASDLAKDFRVVMFDNRGIGESDIPSGPYTVEEMARDALAVMDDAGATRAHVLGASLGGMVAQELALTCPDRVDKLVLMCTTAGGSDAYPLPEPTLRLMKEGPTLPPEVALRRYVENAMAGGSGASRPDIVEKVYAYRLANPPNPAAWAAQASAGATFDASTRVGDIKAPTLVMQGAQDVVVDPRNGEQLSKRIPGAQLVLLPGAGHLLFWEEPERCLEAIRRFLAGGAPTAATGGQAQ